MREIIAQALGYAGLIVYISMFWQKDRKRLILFSMAESVLYGLHYCLIDGLTGGLIDIVCAVMMVAYLGKEKKYLRTATTPSLFALIYLTILIFTYQGLDSIVVFIAILISVFADWNDSPRVIRVGGLMSQVLWLLYSFLVGSVPGIIGDAMVLASAVGAVITHDLRPYLQGGPHEPQAR